MKIALITLEYPPFKGGVANYYYGLVSNFPDAEKITVIDNGEGRLCNPRFKPSWLPAFGIIDNLVRKQGIDHILVGHILPIGTVTWLLSWIYGYRYSVFLHGMDFEFALRSKRKRWIARKILRRADKVICANSYVAARLASIFSLRSNVDIINPGISARMLPDKDSVHRLKERYGLSGKRLVLSIGRMVKRKGFDKSIEAFSKASIPNAVYLLSGTGPDEDYIKQKASGAADIRFIEDVTDEEKWLWLAACDIFIMPSREINGDIEGFGIVYLEANLMSKPVIAGKSGGVGDAVIHGLNGILVDPENIEEIKNAIVWLLNNQGDSKAMGSAGRQRVIDEFSWEIQAGKLYRSLNKDIKNTEK